jgi:hypothetical protein
MEGRSGVRRRATGLVAALLLAAGCGGAGGTPPPTGPPAAGGSPGSGASKLVVLDAQGFDALVLAGPRPSLVKFQSPT